MGWSHFGQIFHLHAHLTNIMHKIRVQDWDMNTSSFIVVSVRTSSRIICNSNREKLVSHHQAVHLDCWIRLSLSRLFLTLFDMINTIYHGKPLMFILVTFREKLVSHHQTVNLNCWIRLSLSRLFLTLFDMINTIYHDKPLFFIKATFREKLVSFHLGCEWNRFLLTYVECRIESCVTYSRSALEKWVGRTGDI